MLLLAETLDWLSVTPYGLPPCEYTWYLEAWIFSIISSTGTLPETAFTFLRSAYFTGYFAGVLALSLIESLEVVLFFFYGDGDGDFTGCFPVLVFFFNRNLIIFRQRNIDTLNYLNCNRLCE